MRVEPAFLPAPDCHAIGLRRPPQGAPDPLPDILELTRARGLARVWESDVDGTLLTLHGVIGRTAYGFTIHPRLREAAPLLFADGNNLHFVIKTARPHAAAAPLVESAGLPPSIVISDNGGYAAWSDDRYIAHLALPPGSVEQTVRTYRPYQEHASLLLHANGRQIAEARDSAASRNDGNRAKARRVDSFHRILAKPSALSWVTKAQVAVPDERARAQLLADLEREVGPTGAHVVASGGCFLEIAGPKGKQALDDAVYERLDVKPDAPVLYSGDGPNDAQSIKEAMFGFATADAAPEAQRDAMGLLPTAGQGGVAFGWIYACTHPRTSPEAWSMLRSWRTDDSPVLNGALAPNGA
jgi:hydroxymethylpyrimidine pyrophosphatase-like HAD family hydrolase